MHKDFYASGFLYHPKSQQILLQQNNLDSSNNVWTLLQGDATSEEDIKESFLKIVDNHLNIKLKLNSIFSVYDYTDKNKTFYVLYAHIKKLEKFNNEDNKFSWFTFKQVHKLSMHPQTKQNIIIGQRVIDSSIRKSLGIQTIG